MSEVWFIGQVKPEDAEQFQDLHPGKWGVYVEEGGFYGERWFLSPISLDPFNHHVLVNYKWLEEDYGIKELLLTPHTDLLKEVLEQTPDESEPWGTGTFDGATTLIFDLRGYKDMIRKEIENPTIKDKFV